MSDNAAICIIASLVFISWSLKDWIHAWRGTGPDMIDSEPDVDDFQAGYQEAAGRLLQGADEITVFDDLCNGTGTSDEFDQGVTAAQNQWKKVVQNEEAI